MIAHMQKTMIFLMLAMAIPMVFSGCTKKTSFPHHCRKNADCHIDGKKGICHMNKCEECVMHSDCPDPKQCINYRCETTCQVDADCGPHKHCEDNMCHKDCNDNSDCSGDRVCTNGRCLSSHKSRDPYSAAGCQGLEKIHFDFDSYKLSSDKAREHVQALASCLENNPGFTVQVEGHTDDRGLPSYNMALGEKRALAVKNYLELEKGIAASRVSTVSYGEQKPLVDEKNEQAWYQNRRAEFKLDASR